MTIHQPDFLPWLGFFDRLGRSDLFVVLDDVQFLRRGWQHRDRIKTAAGETWLTVPVRKKGRYAQRINETETDDGTPWRERHLGTVRSAYGKAPFFDLVFPRLEAIYRRGDRRLQDFNMALLDMALNLIAIDVKRKMASDYGVEAARSERILQLCRAVGADTYVTGQGSRDYLDEAAFSADGIAVEWQAFDPPRYPQMHGDFIPGLSVIDALMNCGPETRSLLAP